MGPWKSWVEKSIIYKYTGGDGGIRALTRPALEHDWLMTSWWLFCCANSIGREPVPKQIINTRPYKVRRHRLVRHQLDQRHTICQQSTI